MAKGTIIVLLLILVLGGGAFVYYDPLDLNLLGEDEPTNEDPMDDISNENETIIDTTQILKFYEFEYLSDDPFVEFQVKNETLNIEGLKMTNGTDILFDLPDLNNLEKDDLITIYLGVGTNQSRNENGTVIFYLDTSYVPGISGELLLEDSNNQTIDYFRWGGSSQSWTVTEFWSNDDHGIIAESGESLQRIGTNANSSDQWMSLTPTPELINVLTLTSSGFGITYSVSNGKFQYPLLEEDYSIHRTDTNIRVVGSNPVEADLVRKIGEYINHTLDFYEEQGFNAPNVAASGKIEVVLVNNTGITNIAGGASANGRIELELGTNITDIDLKVAIEHELMHQVQFAKYTEDGHVYRRLALPLNENLWWLEGMAEFWGIRSAMDQFNLTYTEVKNQTKAGGGPNWWDHGRDLNTSVFKDWNNVTGWNGYELAFQMTKYIFETYNKTTMIAIHNCLKYNSTSGMTVNDIEDCVQEVLGLSLDVLIAEFYAWKTFDRQDGEIPPPTYHQNVTAGGIGDIGNNSIIEIVEAKGAVINRINYNGTGTITINITATENQNWTFVVFAQYNGFNESAIVYNQTTIELEISPTSNLKYYTIIKINNGNSSSGLNFTITTTGGSGSLMYPKSSSFNYSVKNYSNELHMWTKLQDLQISTN